MESRGNEKNLGLRITVVIPTTWFRRLVFFLFVMEVGGGVLWAAAKLAPDQGHANLLQTVGSLVFLFGFYAGMPLVARYLAPQPCTDPARQTRLASLLQRYGSSCPVFLYEHPDKEANTVGLWPSQSRIYITTGLFDRMSDEGLIGILGHENTHARERHILVGFVYACIFALGSYASDSRTFFVVGFLLFLGLRRYMEYRADAGGALLAGPATMSTGLRELAILYPSAAWHRWLTIIMAYPTLPMRLRALETKRPALL
jgi:Zn-dependent protease with chaperone function